MKIKTYSQQDSEYYDEDLISRNSIEEIVKDFKKFESPPESPNNVNNKKFKIKVKKNLTFMNIQSSDGFLTEKL